MQRTSDGSLGIAITAPSDQEPAAEIGARLASAIEPAPDGWFDSWHHADRRARAVLDEVMDAWDEPSEPRIARDVAAAVPEGGTLVIGNSTPIRDLDMTMASRGGIRVIANRGASGIDGLVSTAIGAASASHGPTVALIGDLTAIHDLGALAWNAQRIDLDLTIVVIDNGGGHIFSMLPQQDLPEHRRLFVTPHDLPLAAGFQALGIDSYLQVDAADNLTRILQRPRAHVAAVVSARTSPRRDRDRRSTLRRKLADALT